MSDYICRFKIYNFCGRVRRRKAPLPICWYSHGSERALFFKIEFSLQYLFFVASHQVARKLAMVEADLERAEERAESGES